MTTLLRIATAPAGLLTRTAKSSEPPAPGGRSETPCVQVVPGKLPSGQLHPGVPAPASNFVWSGTVSVITTPVAVPLPMLANAIVYTSTAPGDTSDSEVLTICKTGAPGVGVAVGVPVTVGVELGIGVAVIDGEGLAVGLDVGGTLGLGVGV